MKSISELTDFYYDKLHADLLILEEQRKAVAKSLIVRFSVVGVITFLFVIYIGNNFGYSPDILFIGIGTLSLAYVIYKYTIKDYASNFKEAIIRPLIGAIDKNLNYMPDALVSKSHFIRSKLFDKTPDIYEGNDLVRGEIDSTPLEFSDIVAQYETRNSKGERSTHLIFQGLFIVAEFNKKLQHTTIVLPDKAEKLFGSLIGSWLQSNNFTKNDLIKLDNSEFEKAFVVYGNDQIEARYILTHTLMERILEYKKRSGQDISLSFIENKLYMGIHYDKDLFEPTVFSSLLDLEVTLEYIKTLQLAISIVEELKLNEKLWSKL